VAMQRQPNPRKDNLVIPSRIVEISEHAGIRSDPEPTFTQHGKTAERSDAVWVQVDQCTHEEVQNRNKKLAGRKA
jgi:hypothetical protein